MIKSAGMGDNFYVGGYDLSGDVGSVGKVSGGNAPLDVTAINQSGFDRIGGLRDSGIDFTTWFNTAALAEHAALSTLPTANVQVSYFRGQAIGNPAASMVAKQVNYDGTRGADGSFSFAVSAVGTGYGLEWGEMLTAGVRTDTTATAGTAYDSGAASSFGLQAYLHVFSVVGTSMTATIQESSDNAGDAYASVVGGAFAVVNAGSVSAQRIATATNLSVERYLKVTTSGTFSSALFAVMVVRNSAVPVF